MEDLKADKAELESLLNTAQRPFVKQLLNKSIQEVQGKILLAEHDEAENEKARAAAKKMAEQEENKESEDGTAYRMINKYSWEDTGKFIKVYVTDLPGIKDLADDNIDMDFTENSFALQIRGLEGVGNVRLAVPELFSTISLEGSKLKKKSSSVTIQM